MALSSDEIIKREIVEQVGYQIGNYKLRVFPESSRDDQKLFIEGGLTFSYNGTNYGSCDAAYYDKTTKRAIVAIEGTDALNRNSTGNAQYQRFHHALGAVKNDLIGVYYLKKGSAKIQPDLFGMCYFASKKEKGSYLVVDDLAVVKKILELSSDVPKQQRYISDYLENIMFPVFKEKFDKTYKGSWERFSKRRSTIIKSDCVIKYAGRSLRNFTDGSQRAGHIAVGEMFLTKYYFYDKQVFYLLTRMTREDVVYLDTNKPDDKEWYLLRNEENVKIKTLDDVIGLPKNIKKQLLSVKDVPLKKEAYHIHKKCVEAINEGLRNGSMRIRNTLF